MSDIRPLHHIATHSGNASDVAGGVLQRNNNGDSKLAQSSIDVYYYGCVFDTGYEEYRVEAGNSPSLRREPH